MGPSDLPPKRSWSSSGSVKKLKVGSPWNNPISNSLFPKGAGPWAGPRQTPRMGAQHTGLLPALAVSAFASSSSSELSEVLMGSDTRFFLACSAASSSAFRFWPTSEVLQDKVSGYTNQVTRTTPGDLKRPSLILPPLQRKYE